MYDVKETDASFTEASAPINSIICLAYPVNSNEAAGEWAIVYIRLIAETNELW